jgi:small subunit ribosomal protein S7
LSKESKKSVDIKLFGKWRSEGLAVQDPGLKRYVSVKPVLIPHSGGRHEHQRFRKSTVNVVERLTNNMMRHGRAGGKKGRAIGIVKNAFDIINLKTGKNPLEVLVKAIENSAPCEEVTRIAYGGVVYPISVDIAPQRRLDLTLRFITDGARQASLGNPKTIDEALADEITFCASRDSRGFAIRKKDEMERVALASR